MVSFKASKSKGRQGWCVIFFHPLLRDVQGKNRRVRRGLGTRDDAEADKLVEELNLLLSDQSYWSAAERERASREFDDRIVRAFYDDLKSQRQDAWESRDLVVPLPGPERGYSRVLLLGATGSGKTTLLRQLIGSHPINDRFPSTSTAKTTVFDTEIVLAEGPFRAVVSFLSREHTRYYVEECVLAAIVAQIEGATPHEQIRRLLTHAEQRFRLSYLLGTLQEKVEDDEEDDEDETAGEETSEIGEEEREALRNRLREFTNRIAVLGEESKASVSNTLNVDPKNLPPVEREAFQEILEGELQADENVQAIIDDLMDEIETKFDLINQGEVERDHTGWPVRWTFETTDRTEVIRSLNKFSSNYAPNFGHLLTPLVQGLRVAGPFSPEWTEDGELPKVVIMDGEGLGHTPDTALSLPTHLTKRFDQSDVILLVDNATQPVQAGAQLAIRSIVSAGYVPKLVVAFTHLDLVVGDNLPTASAKREHVQASLDNAIHALEKSVSPATARALRRHLGERVFFLSRINEPLSGGKGRTQSELVKMIKVFEKAILPPEPIEVRPVYDTANLVICVCMAADAFYKNWLARLGLAYESGVPAEHWTRIKALSRRFALQWADEYDTLRPVADLIQLLSERFEVFISNPREWQPQQPKEEEAQAAIDQVKQEVYKRLHNAISDRMFHQRLKEWDAAYLHRGPGSTRDRARDIRGIYEEAAPVPSEKPTSEAIEFLDKIRSLFREAAEAAGAKVI
jgi:energy-coupling factor transporter ATP-binding protein EcfA2